MPDDSHFVLEPEQLAAASETKLPRRVLGRWVLTLLLLLRIYVLIAVPLVAYAFIRALHTGQP
ncbi:hypothetical protein [Lichenicoccus sp.]|uniref:hypothetical protein n=1 Tax=Lichenicoccus sp. TaxID=2781899 RepID=UPI003D1533A5